MTLDLQSPKFKTIALAWLDHIDARVEDDELSRHTSVAYWQATRPLIALFGDTQVAQIGRRDVQEAVDTIRRKHGKSAARSALSRLKALWRWALDEELTEIHCPAVRIRQPKVESVRRPVTGESAMRMADICWNALLNPHHRLPVSEVHAGFFLLLCGTGLRSSEGTHAMFTEWDSANRIFTVGRHKGGKQPKPIHLGEGPAFVLDYIVEQDWPRYMPEKCHGKFFPSVRASRGHIEDPWRAWQRLVEAAKLPKGTCIHDLRHGFADTIYAQSRDLWAVKTALGHKSIATTQKYVSGTPKQILIPVVEKASDLLIGRPEADDDQSGGAQ